MIKDEITYTKLSLVFENARTSSVLRGVVNAEPDQNVAAVGIYGGQNINLASIVVDGGDYIGTVTPVSLEQQAAERGTELIVEVQDGQDSKMTVIGQLYREEGQRLLLTNTYGGTMQGTIQLKEIPISNRVILKKYDGLEMEMTHPSVILYAEESEVEVVHDAGQNFHLSDLKYRVSPGESVALRPEIWLTSNRIENGSDLEVAVDIEIRTRKAHAGSHIKDTPQELVTVKQGTEQLPWANIINRREMRGGEGLQPGMVSLHSADASESMPAPQAFQKAVAEEAGSSASGDRFTLDNALVLHGGMVPLHLTPIELEQADLAHFVYADLINGGIGFFEATYQLPATYALYTDLDGQEVLPGTILFRDGANTQEISFAGTPASDDAGVYVPLRVNERNIGVEVRTSSVKEGGEYTLSFFNNSSADEEVILVVNTGLDYVFSLKDADAELVDGYAAPKESKDAYFGIKVNVPAGERLDLNGSIEKKD